MKTEIFYIQHLDSKNNINELLDIKSNRHAAEKVKTKFLKNNPTINKLKVRIFKEEVTTEHPYKVKILFNNEHSITEIHIAPNINECLENNESIDTSKFNIRIAKDKLSVSICLYAEDDIIALNKTLIFLNKNLIRLLQ